MIVKRIAWMLAVFVIAVVIFIVSVLHSPFLMQNVLKFFVQKNLKGYTIHSLTIGRQQWAYPGTVNLFDVSIRISSKDAQWWVKAREVHGQNIHRILFVDTKVPVQAEGVDLPEGLILVNGANANGQFEFHRRSLNTWRADVTMPHLQFQKYQMTHVSMQVTGANKTIDIQDLEADLYQGHMRADLNLQLLTPVRYQSQVFMKGINVDLLRGVNDALYQQVQGIMDAELSLDGQGNRLQISRIAVNMTKNAQIRAALLQFVIPYIPPTQNLAALQELIRKDLKVPVERADLNLQGLNDQKLSGVIHLDVKQINLNLNLPIDILFDGSLVSLMQWYQKLVH